MNRVRVLAVPEEAQHATRIGQRGRLGAVLRRKPRERVDTGTLTRRYPCDAGGCHPNRSSQGNSDRNRQTNVHCEPHNARSGGASGGGGGCTKMASSRSVRRSTFSASVRVTPSSASALSAYTHSLRST